MSKKTKITMLVLFALVLIAAAPFARQLVPAAGSKVSVPPAAFIAVEPGQDYSNQGFYLEADGWFTAPVYLPGSKTVTKVILYAIDNNPSNEICATLYLTRPINSDEDNMGQVCSTGAQPGLRTFEVTNLNPANVSPSNGFYIWLNIGEKNGNLRFHGVKIFFQN